MKTAPFIPSFLSVAFAILLTAPAARAVIIANESFEYSPGPVLGQLGSGSGFLGDWAASAGANDNPVIRFQVTDIGLSMNGVPSTGGSLVYTNGENNNSSRINRAFVSTLS